MYIIIYMTIKSLMITLSPTIAHTAQNQIVKIKNWLPCPCPCRLIIAVKKSSQGAIFSKKIGFAEILGNRKSMIQSLDGVDAQTKSSRMMPESHRLCYEGPSFQVQSSMFRQREFRNSNSKFQLAFSYQETASLQKKSRNF